MKDWISKLTTWIDHNPLSTASLLAIAILCGLMLFSGCEPKVPWGTSGQKLTATEVEATYDAEQKAIAEKVDQAKTDVTALIAEANAAIAQATAQAGAVGDQAARDLKALEAKRQRALDAIDAKYAEWNTILQAGTDLAGQAASGAINPASVVVLGGGLLATLLAGRKDKARADQTAEERKQEIAELQAQIAALKGSGSSG
jgi:hypothetical protein